jgi:hypothetical protein
MPADEGGPDPLRRHEHRLQIYPVQLPGGNQELRRPLARGTMIHMDTTTLWVAFAIVVGIVVYFARRGPRGAEHCGTQATKGASWWDAGRASCLRMRT